MKVLKLLLLFAMGASLSLAGCNDDYLYPVEYPVYDPDGGSDNGGGDEIPVPEKVNNKVVATAAARPRPGPPNIPTTRSLRSVTPSVWGVTPRSAIFTGLPTTTSSSRMPPTAVM